MVEITNSLLEISIISYETPLAINLNLNIINFSILERQTIKFVWNLLAMEWSLTHTFYPEKLSSLAALSHEKRQLMEESHKTIGWVSIPES